MTPTKEIEDDSLIQQIEKLIHDYDYNKAANVIANALRKAWDDGLKKGLSSPGKEIEEARREGLEEAATVAENYPLTYMTYKYREERLHDLKMRISKAISALIDKETK